MDPTGLTTIADLLKATGPYGLVAVLGWAFWRINEKKDREMRELFNQVAALSKAQTTATIKVESALLALKTAIENLAKGGRSADI